MPKCFNKVNLVFVNKLLLEFFLYIYFFYFSLVSKIILRKKQLKSYFEKKQKAEMCNWRKQKIKAKFCGVLEDFMNVLMIFTFSRSHCEWDFFAMIFICKVTEDLWDKAL